MMKKLKHLNLKQTIIYELDKFIDEEIDNNMVQAPMKLIEQVEHKPI